MIIKSVKPLQTFIGLLTSDTDYEEYQRTVLHEFGLTPGCILEHSNPKSGVPWISLKHINIIMKTRAGILKK